MCCILSQGSPRDPKSWLPKVWKVAQCTIELFSPSCQTESPPVGQRVDLTTTDDRDVLYITPDPSFQFWIQDTCDMNETFVSLCSCSRIGNPTNLFARENLVSHHIWRFDIKYCETICKNFCFSCSQWCLHDKVHVPTQISPFIRLWARIRGGVPLGTMMCSYSW